MTHNGMPDTSEITDFSFTVSIIDFNFIYFSYYYADYINLFGPQFKIRRNCVRSEVVTKVRKKV
jgi:hypothetical protein